MKIGILTFHNAHNYGAMLQCYALQQYLISEGYDAEVIDYRPDFYKKQYSENRFIDCLGKNPFRWFNNIYYNYYLHNKRCHSFEHFHEKYLIMSKVRNCQIIPDTYDIYIVGSDQIWNKHLLGQYIDIFFCKFNFEKNRHKYIAYAPSIETQVLTKEQNIYLKTALKNFDAISIRESEAIKLLQPLTDKTIFNVCDPTILANKTIWLPMTRNRIINKKYILVYQIRETPLATELAKRIANEINAQIVYLTARIDKKYPSRYQAASPEDFINLIYYSQFIITTSFHGCAFSVIFNKQFLTFELGDDFDSRTTSLLNNIGLSNRIIHKSDDIHDDIFNKIDYSHVNQRLKKIRDNSRQFLLDAINN